MTPKRGKKKVEGAAAKPAGQAVKHDTGAELDELYRVLERNDYRRVLELGQAQLGSATDKLAVLEAMIDAIENMLFDGEVSETAPLKALEQSLRDERQRLTDAGAKSNVYKKFLDSSYQGE